MSLQTPLSKKNLGMSSPFNVIFNIAVKNINVNDSQNLAFATSQFVIELFPFDYLSNQKQWNSTKKMHFKRNNSLHSCRTFSTVELFCRSWHAEHFCSLNLTFISYSFWNIRRKVLNVLKFDEKRAITLRWVIRFTSKLQGM